MPPPYDQPAAWVATVVCAGAIFWFLLVFLPRR